MTRVLLTGGSGFIAAHILDILLQRNYSVRITVRSEEKAQKLLNAHPKYKGKLDYVIVPELAQPGCFDEAVKSDPPFDAILHTASPFFYTVTNPVKELIEPAIQGTINILQATKKYAPEVKRIVITSSFAAIADAARGNNPGKVYSEDDWSPILREEGLSDPISGYRVSKKFAEKAAWDFVEKEKPNFSITTINPPLVVGPPKPYVSSLDGLNPSNQRTLNFIRGKFKDKLPHSGVFLWADVRDVAEAHVAALEKDSAGGKRFFISSENNFSNQMIVDIIKKEFPQYAAGLPEEREPNNGLPEEGCYTADNTRSKEVLGVSYRALNESIVDLVKVLQKMGA